MSPDYLQPNGLISPKLINSITAATLNRPDYANYADLFGDLSTSNPDKARKNRAVAIVKIAAENYSLRLDSTRTGIMIDTVSLIDTAVTKHGIQVPQDFAEDFFLGILPVLLGVNGIARNWTNTQERNGPEEVANTGTQLLRGFEASQQGGEVILFSPMCAHYQSTAGHSQEAFSKGLADKFDSAKVGNAIAPLARIIQILNQHGISAKMIAPQLTAEPDTMFAMVPATVWGYITNGKIVEMLHTLQRHSVEFPKLLREQFELFGLGDQFTLITPALAEPLIPDHPSITKRTLALAEKFARIFTTYNGALGPKQWHELSIPDLKSFRRWVNQNQSNLEWLCEQSAGLLEDNVHTFLDNFVPPLLIDGWGALDDMDGFYRREIMRRATSEGATWHRDIQRDSVIDGMLTDGLFSELAYEERQTRAYQIMDGVQILADIGIGGRAVYNVALYTSIGEVLRDLNTAPNVAILWPLEEGRDPWAVDAMAREFEAVQTGKPRNLPVTYASKDRREPFCLDN